MRCTRFNIIDIFPESDEPIMYGSGDLSAAYRGHAQKFRGIWFGAYTLAIL